MKFYDLINGKFISEHIANSIHTRTVETRSQKGLVKKYTFCIHSTDSCNKEHTYVMMLPDTQELESFDDYSIMCYGDMLLCILKKRFKNFNSIKRTSFSREVSKEGQYLRYEYSIIVSYD